MYNSSLGGVIGRKCPVLGAPGISALVRVFQIEYQYGFCFVDIIREGVALESACVSRLGISR